MKVFNVNATGLIIRFVCEENGEDVELQVSEMPEPNYLSESIRDSENSTEVEFESDGNGHSYRVAVYKSTVEGNVEVYDTTLDEEIEDFECEEITD